LRSEKVCFKLFLTRDNLALFQKPQLSVEGRVF
jgi:hypothetical protein